MVGGAYYDLLDSRISRRIDCKPYETLTNPSAGQPLPDLDPPVVSGSDSDSCAANI